MYTTRLTRQMNAPRPAVYRALLDAGAVAAWRVPDGGTTVLVVHEGIPDKIPPADNETGTRMALGNLARLVEAGQP